MQRIETKHRVTGATATGRPRGSRSARPAMAERRAAGLEAEIARLKAVEERYRATFEQLAVGIAQTSPDGGFTDANPVLCEMLGYSREELLGMSFLDITHPDDRAASAALRSRLLADPAVRNWPEREKRFVRKDGTVLWGALAGSLVRDAAGNPASFVTMVRDVSRHKAFEERFRATFEQAAVGIVHTSVDRRYLMVNQKFCDMVGYTREELLAMSPGDIAHPDDRMIPQDVSNLRRLLAGEIATFASERRYVRKDGAVIWASRTVSMAREADGTPYLIRVIEDITERKRAEQELRGSEQRFRALFDHAGVGISMRPAADRNARWTHVNEHFCRMLGYTREEMMRLSTADITPPDEAGRSVSDNARLLRGEIASYTREKRILRKDGSFIWVILTVAALPDADNRPENLIAVYQDISRLKCAEEALLESDEKFRQLAEHIPQVFWMSDVEQKSLIYASPAYEHITGCTLAELQANPLSWQQSVHAEDRERVRHARKHDVQAGRYDIEFRVLHVDGSVRWIHDRAFPVRNANGEIYRIAGIGEDVTERKLAEERLVQLAHFDPLTGLPNRALFRDRLRQTVAQARRNDRIAGVMFVDLDRFKLVNDTLGHARGDGLLRQVAARIVACLRAGDTAGRLSGDEFAVILPDLAAAQDAALVAQKLLADLARPFDLEGSEVFISASIGIALYPADSTGVDTLIQYADSAMYAAKTVGRNTYRFYTAEMNERATARLQLQTKLRRALERNEFVLHYQPKVQLATGEVSGAEALLRWHSPENGLVSPDQFIPHLEETGLIVPVGEWVMNAACAQVRSWMDAGLEPVPVAVNVSARQIQSAGFRESVLRALEAHGLEPRWLEIEITESSLMHDPEAAIALLRELKRLGIRLSADDFGTGYSSLSYLKRFPLDALKIDRSFVRDANVDPDAAAITRTVTTLAHSLGLKVVAEGVETEEQYAFLCGIACDEVQGYLFARPLPAPDCTALLRANRRMRAPAVAPALARAPAVLVVDDDEHSLVLTERLLADGGYRVLTALNSQAAFDRLATNHVGVIVCDQRMPDMSGVKLLARVKLMYPETVRIMLSGSDDPDTVTDAINIGEVHKYFVKGRDDPLLRGEVRKSLWRASRPGEQQAGGESPGVAETSIP